MGYLFTDSFVQNLVDDLANILASDGDPNPEQLQVLDERLTELGTANSRSVASYWRRTQGSPLPDVAFRGPESPYYFPEVEPARIFRTSGTSGRSRGTAGYSTHGMQLMKLSILRNARRHLLGGLERPAIIRMVPSEAVAPDMIIAHGMQLIADTFGDPELSSAVVSPDGLDMVRLVAVVEQAIDAKRPVLFIGGTSVYVNVCDALRARGLRFEVPEGSRMMDAGGFKGRSRVVDVESLRHEVRDVFGVAPERCVNLFGMTELASQLYDVDDVPVGPLGERAKGGSFHVEARVRDPQTMAYRSDGFGLLEVVDRAICDRPHRILTGDLGVAVANGVAVVGRAIQRDDRGCSLSLDALTRPQGVAA
jgi:hypothetical protein